MRWFKVAAIAVGILIAFLVVGSVIGFVLHAIVDLVIAALVVGAIVVAVKVAHSRKQVSPKRAKREVRKPADHSQPLPRADVEHVTTPYSSPPPRQSAPDIDEELARLKREMGS
jgi:cell division protein FtsN